jgi:hypothetical protein
VLQVYDLLYFYFERYTVLRKDETNRARWEDIDWTGGSSDNGRIAVRGTKTEESAAWIPLAPVLRDELLDFYQNRPSDEFIFPGRSPKTKGKKIYNRRPLFEKITPAYILQRFHGKKSRHVTAEGLEETKGRELSRRC